MALMVVPSSVPRTTPKKYTTAPTLSEILRCESRQASSIGPAVISSFLFIPHFELDALRFPSGFHHAAFYVLAFYSRHSAFKRFRTPHSAFCICINRLGLAETMTLHRPLSKDSFLSDNQVRPPSRWILELPPAEEI